MTKELSSNQIAKTCVKCGNTADTPEGIIYIRCQLNGKWGSHPCCQACWDKDNPNRLAVKARFT